MKHLDLDDRVTLIQLRLSSIGDYLLTQAPYVNHIGLYSGDGSVALCLAEFYQNTKDQKYLNKLFEYLDHMSKLIQSGQPLMASFCDGLAGYSWLLRVCLKIFDLKY